MISQLDVPGLIQASFRKELKSNDALMTSLNVDVSFDLYQSIQALASMTRKATTYKNFSLLKRCFLLAEYIYTNGDRLVKGVMENIYIYSLSACVASDRRLGYYYKSLMPARFYSIYIHQIINSNN